MSLREKQTAFAFALAELLLWIRAQGWAVTLGEGAVAEQRVFRTASGTKHGTDAVHMPGSLHYTRLACDLNLFVDGKLITDGAHPAWKATGAHWKTLHPDAAWGGDFTTVDSNHVSLRHDGKA